jgi:hypothetical protein
MLLKHFQVKVQSTLVLLVHFVNLGVETGVIISRKLIQLRITLRVILIQVERKFVFLQVAFAVSPFQLKLFMVLLEMPNITNEICLRQGVHVDWVVVRQYEELLGTQWTTLMEEVKVRLQEVALQLHSSHDQLRDNQHVIQSVTQAHLFLLHARSQKSLY